MLATFLAGALQDVCSVLWAFGRLRYKAVRLMDELPLYLGPWLHEFKPSELCLLLVGYTHGRHYHRCVRMGTCVRGCMSVCVCVYVCACVAA